MKLLIDNALSPIVAKHLGDRDFDVVHVRDIGLQSASDTEILRLAEQQGRIIISADTDFGTLLAIRQKQHPSFVLLRRQKGIQPQDTAKLLTGILPQLEDTLRQGAIVVVTDNRIRIRSLPVGRED